jgi:hypothetical protein
MKTKKLFIVIFIILLYSLLGLFGCTKPVKETVEDPTVTTTVKLQELPKDTVVISVDDDKLYVFDKDNKVIYVTTGENITGNGMLIFLFIFLVFFLIISIFANINQ